MTPAQYKTAIAKLGLSQERAGLWLGLSEKTGQNYATKGPPEPVAMLLRLVIRLKLKPENVPGRTRHHQIERSAAARCYLLMLVRFQYSKARVVEIRDCDDDDDEHDDFHFICSNQF